MSKPTIALGFIRGDMIDGAFHDSILKFLEFDSRERKLTVGTGFVKALYLDDKRNELVRDFLKTKADYLMMVDTDIEWEPPQIYQLIDEAEANDRAILAGLYFSFLKPESWIPSPVWFSEVDDNGSLNVFGSFKPGEVIVPLAGAGMGFTLIRRDVFEQMLQIPEWQEDDWTWFGRDRYSWKGMPKHHGEDVCFCVRAGKIGIQTWGHKGVVVRHWKKIPIDFWLFRAMVETAQRDGHTV